MSSAADQQLGLRYYEMPFVFGGDCVSTSSSGPSRSSAEGTAADAAAPAAATPTCEGGDTSLLVHQYCTRHKGHD